MDKYKAMIKICAQWENARNQTDRSNKITFKSKQSEYGIQIDKMMSIFVLNMV